MAVLARPLSALHEKLGLTEGVRLSKQSPRSSGAKFVPFPLMSMVLMLSCKTPETFESVIVVDDDPSYRELLTMLLRRRELAVEGVGDLPTLRERVLTAPPRIVLLDVFLGKEEGLSIIPFLAQNAPHTKVIVMTAFGSVDLAVAAMKMGASTFIVKTEDPDRIADEVVELAYREEPEDCESEIFLENGLIGESRELRTVKGLIHNLKDISSTVLLTGESGTGKEMVARSLHHLSKRRTHPFHAINCGAIPENLLESELFGHRRGAFTDARENRQGLFEYCSDGTLLLDEIGEMPLHLQVKLLRVLQEKEVMPVGSSRSVKVNTRIVAATNRDLRAEVERRRFREDLFYRLNVIHIDIPPLRERREDIPALVASFVGYFSREYGKLITKPSEELITRLQAYDWPGNVRELRNAVERGVVLARHSHLQFEDLFAIGWRQRPSNELETDFEQFFGTQLPPFTEARQSFEKAYLKKVLLLSKGNIATASRLAGRYRADIYRLMSKYGLSRNGTFS